MASAIKQGINVDCSDGVDISDAKDLSSDGLPYVLTQAGCDPDEDNDCGIVALALTTDLPYSLIHEIARVCCKRKDKKSTLNMMLASVFYPFKLRRVNKKPCRLYKLVEKFPKGRYYVQIGGRNNKGKVDCHALALIDGKIYDRHISRPLRWVTGVWKLGEGLKGKRWFGWRYFNTN